MKRIVKYDKTKTYMFPNGDIATPEIVLKKFPASAYFEHIIETDEGEEVIFAFQNLSAMKSLLEVAKETPEADSITEIQTKVNIVPVYPPSAEERTAAAMEFQNLVAVAGCAPKPEIIKDNYNKGLWNKAMVELAATKSAITATEFTAITGEKLPVTKV